MRASTWLWLIPLWWLCGCSKTLQLGDFQHYVNDFEQASRDQSSPVSVDNLIIEFASIDPVFGSDTVGLCRAWEWPTRRIQIDQVYWNKASETGRHLLLYHELGHCVLSRNHQDKTTQLVAGIDSPASLMYAKLIGEDLYTEHTEYYLRELFHPDDPGTPYYTAVGSLLRIAGLN